MPTDWTKPFPRNALLITWPNSEEAKYVRPSELWNKPIPLSEYALLEEERSLWYAEESARAADARDAARRELLVKQARKLARDGLEVTADRVLNVLSGWKKYVDTARWSELEEWMLKHPQRWTESDHLFSMLDSIDWDDPFASLMPEREATKPPRPGRPKGTPNSSESNKRRSETAKARWEDRRRSGWVHPKTREKSTPRKEDPY